VIYRYYVEIGLNAVGVHLRSAHEMRNEVVEELTRDLVGESRAE